MRYVSGSWPSRVPSNSHILGSNECFCATGGLAVIVSQLGPSRIKAAVDDNSVDTFFEFDFVRMITGEIYTLSMWSLISK